MHILPQASIDDTSSLLPTKRLVLIHLLGKVLWRLPSGEGSEHRPYLVLSSVPSAQEAGRLGGHIPEVSADLAGSCALAKLFFQPSAHLNQSSSCSSASSTCSSSSTVTGDSLLAVAPLPLLLFAGLCCEEIAALSPTKSLPVQSVWQRGHFFELWVLKKFCVHISCKRHGQVFLGHRWPLIGSQ